MRIAFLTSEFVTEPYFAGGLAQYLGRTVRGLAGRGHEVEVFVAARESGRVEYEGATVHRVRVQPGLFLHLLGLTQRVVGRPMLLRSRAMLGVARSLDRALRSRNAEARFDIIQAASWMATGLRAARRPVAPVVVRVSSYSPLLNAVGEGPVSLDLRIGQRLEMASMRRASAVYGPSRFLAGRVREASGIQVHVVRPVFEVAGEDANVAPDVPAGWSRYLLYFGRMCRYKGAAILADAVRPLLSQLPEFHLVIAGPDNGDQASRRLLALQDAHPSQVRYLGVLPPHQLQPVLRSADCVVLPSLMDNLPNTCLEAMSFGRVVIGPDGVSFDELIKDGESGILFELGNAESLRAAIVRAWELPASTRNNLGRAARQVIDGFAPANSLAELESFFESVIGGVRPPGAVCGRAGFVSGERKADGDPAKDASRSGYSQR